MNPLPTLSTKTRYRDEWQHSSDNLRSQGCYKWMARQLDELEPHQILVIGCGSGNGLLAFIARFEPTTLISLEENIDCIETAGRNLAAEGQHPVVHGRLQYLFDPSNKKYRVLCSDEPLELQPGLSIVQTDITREDSQLIEAMEKEAPFDAITVWLIGTDGHNLFSVDTNPPDYRRHLQRQLCELVGRLLRPGGWIQFVDRTDFPLTEDQERDLVTDHKTLLESTPIEFLKFSNHGYKEAGEKGIPIGQAVRQNRARGRDGPKIPHLMAPRRFSAAGAGDARHPVKEINSQRQVVPGANRWISFLVLSVIAFPPRPANGRAALDPTVFEERGRFVVIACRKSRRDRIGRLLQGSGGILAAGRAPWRKIASPDRRMVGILDKKRKAITANKPRIPRGAIR